MNKIAIIYTSKHGTTEKVSFSIAEKLKELYEIELISLKKKSIPKLDDFECLILGTPIYAGQSSMKMKNFYNANRNILLQKKIALFVCGMYPYKELREKELNDAYPQVFQEKAIAKEFLGGEFNFEKMNFVERLIIKKISKTNKSVSKIDWDNVEGFVKNVCKQLNN